MAYMLTPDEGPSLETSIFALSFQVVREPLPFAYMESLQISDQFELCSKCSYMASNSQLKTYKQLSHDQINKAKYSSISAQLLLQPGLH